MTAQIQNYELENIPGDATTSPEGRQAELCSSVLVFMVSLHTTAGIREKSHIILSYSMMLAQLSHSSLTMLKDTAGYKPMS